MTVARKNARRRKTRGGLSSGILLKPHAPAEAAAIDALFHAFAQNLARKLVHSSAPTPCSKGAQPPSKGDHH
ncbi:MAG: hypothetical protein AB8B88_11510 [Devosiaceae bacterium]